MCWLLLIFLDRESTQNVYNGKFSNVNNEFNVTMLETKNLLRNFIINQFFLQPAIGH